MFMLEPAVATVSICLPAISALATRGFRKVPTSYLRGTWSKWTTSPGSPTTSAQPRSSKDSTLKSTFYPTNRGNTANVKTPCPLPASHRNTLDERSVSTPSTNKVNKVSWIKSPSSSIQKVEAAGKRLPTRSMELERRVLDYYQNSEFPDGFYHALSDDLEKGGSETSQGLGISHADGPAVGVSPLRRNPIPVPSKDTIHNSSSR